ncbi:MAG: dTMP kinase [Clostridia bacterium]|nr:dTMP kinase [Clostridia bacterium]MBQ7046679.1 dTMP kinase [Oscillospiraceae bacterium]
MEQLRLKANPYSGKLISFCGLDGCGKTTLIKRLEVYLSERGQDVVLTKQPTNAVRKSEIFRTFMDCENNSAFDYLSLSLLAASDRVQHTNKVIAPVLETGKTIISDRYFYSCLANLRARGYKDAKWIYEVSEYLIKPDVAFFLDIDVETAVKRVRSRIEERDRYIDMPLQYALRDEYLEIASLNNGIVISTDQSEDDAFEKVLEALNGHF